MMNEDEEVAPALVSLLLSGILFLSLEIQM